jgi:hypothetical protein
MNYTSKALSSNGVSPEVKIKGRFQFVLTGTWTGIVSLEVSVNGSEWSGYNNFSANVTKVYDAGDGLWYRFRVREGVSFTGTVTGTLSSYEETDSGSETIVGDKTFQDPVTFQNVVKAGDVSLKEDSGTLKVRNLDDTDDAPISASDGTFSGSVVIGTTYYAHSLAQLISALENPFLTHITLIAPVTLTEDLTFDKPVVQADGATITTNGHVLTINVDPPQGLWQRFNCAPGEVVGLKRSDPIWFGAVDNETVDSISAFTAASASISPWGTVTVSEGHYGLGAMWTVNGFGHTRLSDGAHLYALDTMDAMIYVPSTGGFGTGTEGSVRPTYLHVSGGMLWCNDLAVSGVWVGMSAYVEVHDIMVDSPNLYHVRLGDRSAVASAYDLRVYNITGDRLVNDMAEQHPGSIGIFGDYATDSRISNCIIMGAETGFKSLNPHVSFLNCHAWPHATQSMLDGFVLSGSGNSAIQCFADTPSRYGFHVTKERCQVIGNWVSNYQGRGGSNVVGIEVDGGIDYGNVTIIGNSMQAWVGFPFLYDIRAGAGTEYTALANSCDSATNRHKPRIEAAYLQSPLNFYLGSAGRTDIFFKNAEFANKYSLTHDPAGASGVGEIGLYDYANANYAWRYNPTTGLNLANNQTAIKVQSGNTAGRPSGLGSPGIGRLYYDTDLGKVIVWGGSTWKNMDGSAL